MFRNSLIREMNFKANFLLWILVELCWFAGQIVFLEVLFAHIGAIGDWTKWQVVLLVATHQLIGQLYQGFFFVNVAGIPELVRTGRMDFTLLLPMDSQFAVSTRQFGLDSIINAMVSVALVIFCLGKLGITPGVGQVLLYGVALGFGIAVHYAIMFFLATASFWIVRSRGLMSGYFSLFTLARYPDVIYRGGFRLFFTWVIPIILVANVPARVLMGTFDGSPLGPMLQLLAAAVIVLVGSRMFWKLALTRYTSASS